MHEGARLEASDMSDHAGHQGIRSDVVWYPKKKIGGALEQVTIQFSILDLELEYNEIPEGDFCGSCNRCIEACPTNAILPNRTLSAKRCISYQTIENKGPVDPELQGKMTGRFFGCDICQDVCPWNRKAVLHTEPAFEPAPGLLEMSKEDWVKLEKEEFNRMFKNSAVKRAGYNKLRENISFLE